jgi:hypothetical protein
MTLYKCGHTRDTIILDDNIISYLAYLDWAESVGINGTKELCWDCWNEKNCKIESKKQMEERHFNIKKGEHQDFVTGGDGFPLEFFDFLTDTFFDDGDSEYTTQSFKVIVKWDNEKNCKIDSQQVTDNQNKNKVQKPSSDGSQKTADRILNWSSYCATTNNRNQCSKETCTIFPICKIRKSKGFSIPRSLRNFGFKEVRE